jgi:hypothetical protein
VQYHPTEVAQDNQLKQTIAVNHKAAYGKGANQKVLIQGRNLSPFMSLA